MKIKGVSGIVSLCGYLKKNNIDVICLQQMQVRFAKLPVIVMVIVNQEPQLRKILHTSLVFAPLNHSCHLDVMAWLKTDS